MIIRFAQNKDAAALTGIYNYEVLHGTATFDVQPKTLEERLVWMNAHSGGKYPLFVADLDGTVAGYASLSPYRAKEAYSATAELSVYVDSRFRRQGIGVHLMQAIIDYAQNRGGIHTIISVISGGNEASTRIHKKAGFTFCGTVQEAGTKFGKYLNIDTWQLIIHEKKQQV